MNHAGPHAFFYLIPIKAHCSWELRRIVKLVIFVLRLLAPPSLTSGHDWYEALF